MAGNSEAGKILREMKEILDRMERAAAEDRKQAAEDRKRFDEYCRQAAEDRKGFDEYCRQGAEDRKGFDEYCRQGAEDRKRFDEYCRQAAEDRHIVRAQTAGIGGALHALTNAVTGMAAGQEIMIAVLKENTAVLREIRHLLRGGGNSRPRHGDGQGH